MIYILDAVTYKPGYSFETLATEPLGGTEGSILRLIATLGVDNFTLIGDPDLIKSDAKFVVHIRTARHLDAAHKRAPNARQVVWHHDLGGTWCADDIPHYVKHKPTLLFLTEYHKSQFMDRGIRAYTLEQVCDEAKVLNYILPPLDHIPQAQIDRNKLLFTSSPHKGLRHTIESFVMLRKRHPKLELHICNPGYLPDMTELPEGCVALGSLPSWKVWQEMATSFCMFHINHVFAETFGLVYRECNMLGTPFIGHPLGSLPETTDNRQLIDTRSQEKIVKKFESYLEERITPKLIDLTPTSAWFKYFGLKQ